MNSFTLKKGFALLLCITLPGGLYAFHWDSLPRADRMAYAQSAGDALRALMLEGKTGFAARRGKRISDGKDGSIRYKAAPIDALHAQDQYIATKNGAEVLVVEFKGEDQNSLLFSAMRVFTDESGDHGPTIFNWSLTDSPHSEAHCPNNNCQYVLVREHDETPPLARYKEKVAERQTTLLVGPVQAYDNEEYPTESVKQARRVAKKNANFKSSGNSELDAIQHVFDSENYWAGYNDAAPIKHLFQDQADNDYDGTVGEAYTAPDGSVRYRAPRWLGADDAFYIKDTHDPKSTGAGTLLFLFFSEGQPHTTEVLGWLRYLFAEENHPAIGHPGPHEFVYLDRDGSATLRYRYDVSADAPYKGLTVMVQQTWELKEKRSRQAASDSAERAYQRDREEEDAKPRVAVPLPKETPIDYEAETQARRQKLHEESNAYYNKLHPYNEGRERDSNNEFVH